MNEWKYTILGQPMVKKSNQKVAYVRNLGRMIKYNTKSYNAWHKAAYKQLLTQRRPLTPIDVPVNLCCKFFVRTNGRVDLSALYEGIQDLLVEMNILADDKWQIVGSHNGSCVEIDRLNPRMEITISFLQ